MLRQFWDARRGPPHPTRRIEDVVPELPASLESLFAQGYSQEDVALMFGVSGCAVHVWAKRFGLRPRFVKACRRVWCDITHRFVPITGHVASGLGISQPSPKRVASQQKRSFHGIPNPPRGRPPATHCLRGHPLAGNSLSDGACRICHNARSREAKRKARAQSRHPRAAVLICPRGHDMTLPGARNRHRQCILCIPILNRARNRRRRGDL